MKIKLVFEDKFYSAINLNNDFSCVGKTIFDVERQITDDFRRVFDTMLPIHSSEYHYDLIEINFIEYHTKENEDTLGYFSHEKTIKNSAYNFGLYYDTCKEYLINKWSDKEDINKKYVGLWEHEIIHMLDFKLITNFREDRNKFMKKEFKPTPTYSPFFDYTDKPKDYWYLLDIINLMRVEGLATLYECLLGFREDNIQSFEKFKESLIFQFQVIINFVENVKYFKSNEHKQHADLIKLIRSLCYETGKWIMLHILSNKEEVVCNTTSKQILKTGNFKVNLEECNSIMKEALKIDFTEFLSMLLQLSNPEKQFFNSYQLLEDISKLSGGKISNQVSNDLFLLYCTSRANNKMEFIEILSKYVGAKMKEDEIIESYTDLKTNNKSNNYLDNTLFTKTDTLYEKWKNDKQNELLVYALTYILDDEDMIPDDIKFLGYLDDIAVIDSVEFLLKENHN
jgi:uncharacterized membrane protein YkvA (DUF1232 family)